MTNKNECPTSKSSRFSKASQTVLKVAGKQAIHSIQHPFISNKTKQEKQHEHYKTVSKDIFKLLSVLKGVSLKAAQLLSMELELLPKEFQEELKKACYQVPPLNRAVVRKGIQAEFKKTPETIFSSFELTAFAAASIGQVHKATLNTKERVVVKIQYPGIEKTIHSDMKMLTFFLLKLPIPKIKEKKTLIKTYLDECQSRFIEETDYLKEANRLTFFHKKNPFKQIRTPKPIVDLCSKSILTMEYLEGKHLDEWLTTNPTQEEKNHYAQQLWNFFSFFLMNHNILHADPNPGNILFMENRNLGIIDFGCVKEVDPDFPSQIANVIKYHIKREIEPVMDIYNKWGLLSSELQENSQQVEEHLQFFREWLTLPFKEKEFDFGKHPDYLQQRFSENFKVAMNIMHNTTHNFVMFDRAYMGLLTIFHRLEANLSISFDDNKSIGDKHE